MMEAELQSAHLGFIVGTPKCLLWLQTRVTNSFRMDLLGLAKYQPGSSLDRCSNPCSCLNLDTVSLQRCLSWDGMYIYIYNNHDYSRSKRASHLPNKQILTRFAQLYCHGYLFYPGERLVKQQCACHPPGFFWLN